MHSTGQPRGVKTGGEVVHIRVNSEDIMTAIDIIDKAGIDTNGLSLAMVVKWAMSYAFEACRVSGSVPRRDGFEYNQMVGRFLRGRGHEMASLKGKVSRNMILAEINGAAKPQDIGLMQEPDTDLSLVVPKNIQYLIPCSHTDVMAINKRLIQRDPNIDEKDVAKWLMYCENRGAADVLIAPDMILRAEQLIRSIWPEYPSVIGAQDE